MPDFGSTRRADPLTCSQTGDLEGAEADEFGLQPSSGCADATVVVVEILGPNRRN